MAKSKRPERDLRPALVILNGDFLAVQIPLEREDVILGRALEAGIRLNDTRVSRQHARISALQNLNKSTPDYLLTDLNSSNGTFLNGQKIAQETLQNGDKITIGKHILRFELLDEIYGY